MAVDKALPLPEVSSTEPVTSTGSLSLKTHESHEKGTLSGASLREQHLSSNLDILQAPSEPHHLPTPEPSPSPRSTSPSLVVTETSSTEFNGTMDSANRKRSESFEHVFQDRDEETPGEALSSPGPISKKLPPHELHKIPEEKVRKSRKPSISISKNPGDDKVLKLSPMQIEELTGTPESLPLPLSARLNVPESGGSVPSPVSNGFSEGSNNSVMVEIGRGTPMGAASSRSKRTSFTSRAISTPLPNRQDLSWNHTDPRQQSPNRSASYRTPGAESDTPRVVSRHESVAVNGGTKSSTTTPYLKSSMTPEIEHPPSPIPQDIPIPPMSIPTYLQLELASSRPSPLYIHRSSASEYPYESSKIKFERLLNFLLLPPQLEHVLGFGSLACLDAWLHTFTILPLRFLKASGILIQWWTKTFAAEVQFITDFIYHGAGRMWHRRRGRTDSVDCTPQSRSGSRSRRPSQQLQKPTEVKSANGTANVTRIEIERELNSTWGRKHKRTKSQPSTLSSYHKADLLQGAVIICSCAVLMCFDASRMYHSIRGQSAIKLYMIWNVLEVSLVKMLGSIEFLTRARLQIDCLRPLARIFSNASFAKRPLNEVQMAEANYFVHSECLYWRSYTMRYMPRHYFIG
jgi:Eukaryotic membrane protein family